jgi:hypothetical protein
MGNRFSLGGQPETKDQARETRQARENYRNYLTTTQVNVNTEVNAKRLTPDTGNLVLERIKVANTWLQKNPNANYNEITTNFDATNTEIKRLLNTDKPKREIQNQIAGIKAEALKTRDEKKIDEQEYEKLIQLSNEIDTWYKKNNATATTIDFSQEDLKIQSSIRTIVKDANVSNEIIQKLNQVKQMNPNDLLASIQKTEKDLEIKKSQTFDLREGIQVAWWQANKTFWLCLLIFLCLVSGSLAANNAIGRARPYRVLYFLYGAIPFYAPLVILYTIYRRIREGPLPYYAPLPLSIEPATTRLGKILWFPFYWIPDNNAVQEYDKYQEQLRLIAST